MIGVDTNVLIRYLTQDDPQQAAIASDWFETRFTRDEPGFVSVVAMLETVWVLESRYDVRAEEIGAIVTALASMDNLIIEHRDAVLDAAVALSEGLGDFSDVIIGALGRKAQCSTTLTFDRRAARLPDFELAT